MHWINSLRHFRKYWLAPVINIQDIRLTYHSYSKYLSDWRRYRSLEGAEQLHFGLSYPCIFDSIQVTPFDAHYLYQAVWAAKRIADAGSNTHVDIGSDVRFVCQLTHQLRVIFVDIRPVRVQIDEFSCVSGHILSLPFRSRSIQSLSCLHVAEHIGLGRYGDDLNPLGTREACRELARVLAPGGNLFFSVPVGSPRLNFNAHRVHAAGQILEYYKDLDLVEFSMVTDRGDFRSNVQIEDAVDSNYACGLYWFKTR